MSTNGDACHVLFCVDGSQHSLRAIRRAGRLLAPGRALVLHVWSEQPSTPRGREAAADAAAVLAREASEVAAEAGFDGAPLSIRAGERVADTILQAIDSHDPDVVVLGSRGMSDWQSAVLGSVSTSVVHESSRPVLVIPPEQERKDSP